MVARAPPRPLPASTLSPPVRITSLHAAGDARGSPRASSSPRSPVWNQPSRSAAAVAVRILEVAVHQDRGCARRSRRLGEAQLDAGRRQAHAARLAQRVGVGRASRPSRPRSSRSRCGSRVPGKRCLQRADQLDRRGGGAGVELAQAREVVARDVGGEDAVPHRRDAVEAVAAPARDRLEQRLGARLRDQRDLAARLPGREREREARHVEEREHADRALGLVAEDALEAAQVAGAVREHDGLGPARAAAGEEHHVRVGLARRVARAAPPSARARREQRVRVRGVAETAERGDARAARRRPRRAPLDARGVGHDAVRSRHLGEHARLVDAEARVERREDRAELRRSPRRARAPRARCRRSQHALAAARCRARAARTPMRLAAASSSRVRERRRPERRGHALGHRRARCCRIRSPTRSSTPGSGLEFMGLRPWAGPEYHSRSEE